MSQPSRPAARAGAVLALALFVAGSGARPAAAQSTVHSPAHAGPSPAAHAHEHGSPAAGPLTAAARAQLAAVRRATAAYATPEAARAAGFRPVFGQGPLQGEHYVRVDRVLADTFDVERPSVLMFAPVDGRPTLVGVAYAMLHPVDAAPPAGFDGAGDVWHAHDRLVDVPGKHLVMMHAWFVDTPDGPFARYNPWLPYLATGLTPPSAAVLADSGSGDRARRLGLALASASTPPLVFEWLERQGGEALSARTGPHRAAIGALVPQLAAAERAGDHAAYDQLATEAIRHGEAIVAAYRAALPERPRVARLVDGTVDEFLGRGHGIEEELAALRHAGVARAEQ